jgi:tripeptide aminopeptidase
VRPRSSRKPSDQSGSFQFQLAPFRRGLGLHRNGATDQRRFLLLAAMTVSSHLRFTHAVTERFLRYVVIDTQSDPASVTCPSTEKQKDLGRLLASELREMGLSDAHLDEHGYVYATIPANTDKRVPVICFCSHMDTSPDCTGANVKPQIVRNYRGGDIVLPADPTQIIRAAEHPALADQIGNDIVTTDGTTLLGADNKAGIAAIMDATLFMLRNPQIKHGAIKILFTPDEEIGRGVDKVDLKKLGADFAYTIDGETAGNIEDETFCADGVTITIEGVSTHPGFAKGKMEHSIKIAAAIVERLPKTTCSPETTEGRKGFLHPVGISGALETTALELIVRDFTEIGLKEKEALLEDIVKEVMRDFPRSTYRMEIRQQYRNMKQVVDRHPEIIDNAVEAIRRSGLTPTKTAIRGGTDGSRLSFMGLPCPNIFAGEHAFHSRLEWVSVQDMEKAAQTIVHLAMVWEERA